jgi:hypothetical protein
VANINIVVLVLNSQLVHPLADIELTNTGDVLFSELGTSSSACRQLFSLSFIYNNKIRRIVYISAKYVKKFVCC